MIKNKVRRINFLEGDVKDIKLKHLVEEKIILKNGNVKFKLFFGIVFKGDFYLVEQIIKSILKVQI